MLRGHASNSICHGTVIIFYHNDFNLYVPHEKKVSAYYMQRFIRAIKVSLDLQLWLPTVKIDLTDNHSLTLNSHSVDGVGYTVQCIVQYMHVNPKGTQPKSVWEPCVGDGFEK